MVLNGLPSPADLVAILPGLTTKACMVAPSTVPTVSQTRLFFTTWACGGFAAGCDLRALEVS